METGNFLTWLGAIALIGGFAVAVMRWAYQGAGSVDVAFKDAIAAAPETTMEEQISLPYQAGYEAFQQGRYQKALDQFTRALQANPLLAEAHHNQGLTFANLRQDNDAVRSLVRAGELYLEQGNGEGYTQVKQHLEQLKQVRSRGA